MPARTRRQRGAADIWPGFVDALSALLIIVIFLVMVFTLAQYFLSEALSGRDEALARLNRTVAELQDMLSLEKRSNEELRRNLTQVSDQLQASIADRDRLSSQLAELMPAHDALKADLEARAAELAAMTERAEAEERRTAKLEKDLEDAFKTIAADKETIEAKLAEIASLMQDLDALRKARAELEKKVADLAQTLNLSKEELEEAAKRFAASQAALTAAQTDLTAARDRSKALEARLSTEEERTALAQKEIEKAETRLKDALARSGVLESELTEEQRVSAEAKRQVELLNQQIAALRRQLARLEAALEASEQKSKEQRVRIADLGRRLNLALASKVEELARYRSEFFGKLREVLGNRKDVTIVGDRFVFQSEVLFPSGSATLSPGGRVQIANLTKTLLEISKSIPSKLNWVLRVDGHTDKVPISTQRFPSNWELSAERAISVVKFMAAEGVPEDRLVAAGFGEFHPIDPRDTEAAYRRNRRIEFKLTQR